MNDTNVDNVTHAEAVDALKKAGNTVRLVSLFIYFITFSSAAVSRLSKYMTQALSLMSHLRHLITRSSQHTRSVHITYEKLMG